MRAKCSRRAASSSRARARSSRPTIRAAAATSGTDGDGRELPASQLPQPPHRRRQPPGGPRAAPRRCDLPARRLLAEHELRTADGRGAGERRRLQQPRTGARPHLPRDARHQLRPGEPAMLTTYVAYQLIQWGLPYWGAFFATLAISFALGLVLEVALIRPVLHRSVIATVIVTVGLFILIDGVVNWVWGAYLMFLPPP